MLSRNDLPHRFVSPSISIFTIFVADLKNLFWFGDPVESMWFILRNMHPSVRRIYAVECHSILLSL